MPGKEWAIDEPCVRTVCHIWTIFPFHHFPGCGLHVDFMNKGQFWFQMETMLWCPSVLFMAGFAIAIAIPMVFPEVGFESNEHLGNILPLKISFFFFITALKTINRLRATVFPYDCCLCKICLFLGNTFWGYLYGMWSWTNSLWWAIEETKGRKNLSAESVCFRRKVSKMHFLGISATEWNSFLFPL